MNQHPEPFFVVGAQRSGTTMLRLMLNAHPLLFVPFESDFLRVEADFHGSIQNDEDLQSVFDAMLEERFTKQGAMFQTDYLNHLTHPWDFSEFFDQMMRLAANEQGKSRWGIKTPGYHRRIDDLWRLYPCSKIVHIVRDGRGVALAQRNVSWGNHDLAGFAASWATGLRAAHQMSQADPDNYRVTRFEDLVEAPQRELQRISAFLGEDYHEDMLTYHTHAREQLPAVSRAYHGNSVRPPDPGKIDEWKRGLMPDEREVFQRIAGETLAMFGYGLE